MKPLPDPGLRGGGSDAVVLIGGALDLVECRRVAAAERRRDHLGDADILRQGIDSFTETRWITLETQPGHFPI